MSHSDGNHRRHSRQPAAIPSIICLMLVLLLVATEGAWTWSIPMSAGMAVQGPPRTVVTQHNSRQRTGVNDRETELTPDIVAHSIGLLHKFPVRGQVYAQPLYVPTVRIGAEIHRTVFVATMQNNVYAFDADSYSALWSRNFGCPEPFNYVKLNPLSFGGYNIHDSVGILSTPTIDESGSYIYFVARVDRRATGQSSDPEATTCQSSRFIDLRLVLHKVDLATGKDATPPQDIEARLAPKVQLDPFLHLQRPGLLLANGSVYVAFGSNWDTGLWHGWILRLDAESLVMQSVFSTTPTGSGGGIWQAGTGLAADDAGDIYFITGNGTTRPEADPPNLATAFVQLSPNLTVKCYYVPKNRRWLNLTDLDLGSAGVVVLPDGGLVGGGKQGHLYMLGPPSRAGDRRFGLFDEVQVTPRPNFPFIPPASYHHIHGTPVVWSWTPTEARIFVWGERDRLRAYTYVHSPTSGKVTGRTVGGSDLAAPSRGMPGAMLSLSVNGSDRRSAVLWASLPRDDDAFVDDVPGILRAIDPMTLKPLWSNDTDDYLFAKYCPPTVVDGKVFLATLSEAVYEYGRVPK